MAQAQPATEVAGHREGSRWIHAEPSGEELAQWFAANVRIHDGLRHEHYVSGIVLIPQTEKHRETLENGNIVSRERLTFTPYPTASARLAYFHDWIAVLQEDKDVGWAIEPDPTVARSDPLPAGFFPYRVAWQNDAGAPVEKRFIGCSMQVRVWSRDIRSGERGTPLMVPPAGSKIVPTMGYRGPDENALMKAQTGAVGRALALAGMLVIPGTGIATAEDVQEALSVPGGEAQPQLPAEPASGPEGAAEPQLPLAGGPGEKPPTPVEQQRARAAELIGELQAYPDKLAEVKAWASERKLDLNDIRGQALRGAVKLLERKLDEAQSSDGKAES
jgi:hypothetical protein